MRKSRANGTAKAAKKPTTRCAIYTRKSSDEGLDQEFNSLDAQREAAEAYIASQKAEGWSVLPERYDDGRPASRRFASSTSHEHLFARAARWRVHCDGHPPGPCSAAPGMGPGSLPPEIFRGAGSTPAPAIFAGNQSTPDHQPKGPTP